MSGKRGPKRSSFGPASGFTPWRLIWSRTTTRQPCEYSQGCLVVVRDHINLQGVNPLAGPNDERFGPRFPDMTRAYDRAFSEFTVEEGKRLGIAIQEGVYA